MLNIFILEVRKVTGCKKNVIYFTRYSLYLISCGVVGHRCGFNMKFIAPSDLVMVVGLM